MNQQKQKYPILKTRNKPKGFIVADLLIVIVIVPLSLNLIVDCLRIIANSNAINYSVGNMKDIFLLQQKLSFATNFESNGDTLSFDYKDSRYTLKKIDDHLVLTPGAQYFALQVESVCFYYDGSVWMMDISCNENQYSVGLAYES